MRENLHILLGGIPLGCDNIGDEAILACVVQMMRKIVPLARLAVATADAATGAKLGVEVLPSYGFAGVSLDGFDEAVQDFDVYVWCGATGLSDYPTTALDLLERAQRAGVRTFLWGVGMDDELNPVFFRASGKRRLLLRLFGAVEWYENRLRKRLGERLRAILGRCEGIWLRDPQSAEMLRSFGVENVKVTADPAIWLRPEDAASIPSRRHTLGLCLSSQRPVKDTDGVRRFLDTMEKAGVRVLGIPMNPKTDAPMMQALGVCDIFSSVEPEAVATQAAECTLVLSSRLHLLILAANVGTPLLGIARGSKLANFLANFGQQTEGSVTDCDWDALASKVLHLMDDPQLRPRFGERRARAYSALESRFLHAQAEFAEKLTGEAVILPEVGKES